MAKFYHRRADNIMNGTPLPKPHVIGQAPKITLTFQENMQALQNIQNTMGQISDLYDAGYNLYRMIDWSNPELTKDFLVQVVASMAGTVVVVSLVPINIIALFGGVGVFVANTALFKAASVTIAPVLVKKLQRRVEHVAALIRDARKQGKDPVIDVVVFENQRWWAGNGTVSLPSKDHYELPTIEDFTDLDKSAVSATAVFEWIDEDWEVDYKWTDVDPQGWEYYNQRWENGKSSRVMGSFTRRRKWVRHMRLVDTTAVEADSKKND
ncbi:peroxisome- protein [Kappamyces sp. JEL0829]|nr:peroxisome- protein [Kappamyces sp. JEL0829]